MADPAALLPARRLVEGVAGEVERACSRFHDSELAGVLPGRATLVGDLLAELVGVALLAAARTDGAVDPTVGSALVELGMTATSRRWSPRRTRAGGCTSPGGDRAGATSPSSGVRAAHA